ncbi:MAG TPA: hypothetical protein PK079_22655 [Leptospiraceae bacterium]|nr:hypothetical protein [Leptospiraceae bacterium]HNC59901.1 hypothetical protein [Leptospiraceae bacterium]HNE55984.1 hypothetical protein [Leptospiraceae bacterium]HNF57500.1 hypothetical protein [Leptospiraceae bacterium]
MNYFSLLITILILTSSSCKTANPETKAISDESQSIRDEAKIILENIKEHKDIEPEKVQDYVNRTTLYTQRVDAALAAKDKFIEQLQSEIVSEREQKESYKVDALRMRRIDRNIMIGIVSITLFAILAALFYVRKALGFTAF